MISILIPVYNYDVMPLVRQMHQQLTMSSTVYEMLIIDDGSTEYLQENKCIRLMPNCRYEQLPDNIGRSAIRNLLATKASYDTLLFIDAGTLPSSDQFIEIYLQHIHKDVLTGGMTFLPQRPKKPYTLRWLYTKKREAVTDQKNRKRPVICSSNFMIKKAIFDRFRFDESLTTYGCEDVVFFDTIATHHIPITYIDNPVVHDANDTANIFIKKTENALENLIQLIDAQKLPHDRFKVAALYHTLCNIRLDTVVLFFFKLCKQHLIRNFNSSYPSILFFDFYKLGYFCLLKNKK